MIPRNHTVYLSFIIAVIWVVDPHDLKSIARNYAMLGLITAMELAAYLIRTYVTKVWKK